MSEVEIVKSVSDLVDPTRHAEAAVGNALEALQRVRTTVAWLSDKALSLGLPRFEVGAVEVAAMRRPLEGLRVELEGYRRLLELASEEEETRNDETLTEVMS